MPMIGRARTPVDTRNPSSSAGADDEVLLEAGIVIRDMRTNERFWIHDLIVDDYAPLLGADAFAIYASLCCMSNKNQYCWPSLSRLARHWGKGKATVVRAIALLTDLALIYVQRGVNQDGGKANNVYYLLEPASLDEGLASLISALRRRGATRSEAIASATALIPQNWEPLRRKKRDILSRDDWATLIERLAGEDEIDVVQKETRWSATEPDSVETELAGVAVEPGGTIADHGSAMRELSPFSSGPGSASTETRVGSLRDPKDLVTKGYPNKVSPPEEHHQGAGGGGRRLSTDEEIEAYQLQAEEVLIEESDGSARVATIAEIARADVEETARNWGIRVSTDTYYSADQFLGKGGEQWTAEEERKRSFHSAVRRQLEETYRAIGSFTLSEALGQYFTDDLIAAFMSMYGGPDEAERIHCWLVYVRSQAGQGIDNAAGFLRSRIESGQWAPRAGGRRQGR
jgi:hypothetical protein